MSPFAKVAQFFLNQVSYLSNAGGRLNIFADFFNVRVFRSLGSSQGFYALTK